MIEEMLSQHHIHFNEQQMTAATHGRGPAIVLAVAGAGKTTVMCSRIAHLMLKEQVDPRRIRNVTFSKAAARDMQKRFLSLFHPLQNSKQVSFSTIHSMAYGIVRPVYQGRCQSFQLIEDKRKQVYKPRILRAIYKKVNNNYPGEDDMDDLMQKISLVKNRMLSPENIGMIPTSVPAFVEIYHLYEGYKKTNGWLDYDDLLTQAYQLLLQEESLRKKLQQQYIHWQVDEFQDTSLVQWKMIRIMAEPENNLFCVGDDDQMIYGFRGSDPQLLLNFKSEVPGAKTFFMEENHRCGPQVIDISNDIVGKNMSRYEKKAYTKRVEPCNLRTVAVEDVHQQVERVLEEISGLQKNGEGTVGLLYRNNISAIPFADAMLQRKIPFTLRDIKGNVMHHWITQDLLGIIDMAYQSEKLSLFEQHYYKLNGYISREMITWLKANPPAKETRVLDHLLNSGLLRETYQVKAVRDLKQNLDLLTGKKGDRIILFIMKHLGYNLYLDRKRGISLEMADQLLDIIIYLTKGLTSPAQLRSRLESSVDLPHSPGEKIILTTIHSAKGLEFDHVIMVDVIGGLFPSSGSEKALELNQDVSLMEEERRLFYVGLTRSRNDVSVYALTHSSGKKTRESQFVADIRRMKANGTGGTVRASTGEQVPELTPGDEVSHHTFGTGQVTAIKENSVEIRFGGHVKNIARDFLSKVLNLPS